VAGGVEGGLGAHCFEYLKTRIDDVILVSEKEIEDGFCWILDKHQYLIEPSSAVVIAACLSGRIEKLLSPTVIILSGRNVSFATVKSLLNRSRQAV
jgi:threonine dehydratase